MLSRLPPCHVAPPLSPFQYAMQGGDCGSSICRRGGGPTQCFTSLAGTLSVFAGGGGGGGVGGCPPAPPVPVPRPWPLDAPPDPGGAFLMTCCALGANSAAVGGDAAAACSSQGSSTARIARTMPRLIAPGARPGRRNARANPARLTSLPWARPAPTCCAAT